MAENKSNFLDEWAEPLIFGGLALACLFIYGQTIRFDFINLDDHSYVYLNPVVLSGINTQSITWAFSAFYSSNWHPLTWLSHALDSQLFGLNAGAHHAVNAILHLINSCLVFVVFRACTGAMWKSALIAFLFAVHPAHVESVAWISERKDVLSTLFWLLTMLAYVRFARSARAGSGIFGKLASPYMILTVILLALGLMAKPMLVTLPLVLLLLDYWPLKRFSTVRESVPLILEKLPLFALTAASSVVTYLAQSASGSVMGLERFPIEARFVNSVTAYAKYVVLFFYPANLGIWYPFPAAVNVVEIGGAVILLAAITAGAIWQIRERPYIAVGWFWFVGTLVPVIGLVQVGSQSMADRYTYVPYLGLFIILVWGLAELAERFDVDRRVAAAVCVIAVSVLAFVASRQAAFWKNSETLYTRTIAVTKENYFLMNLLCRHYIDRTPAENAERRCSELLEDTSNSVEAHNTIGLLRVELGRYDDALLAYEKAVQINPRAGIVYLNIAVAYAKKGDTAKAEEFLNHAISLADKNLTRDALAYSYNALGEAFVLKKEAANARRAFETAMRYDPTMDAARKNLNDLQGVQETQ